MNKLKYILWLMDIVGWNFGVSVTKPAYDMRAGCAISEAYS